MPSRRFVLEPLLEQIHDAALGALPWEAALGSVARLLRANGAVISLERKHGGGWGVSMGGDARTHSDDFEHFAGNHPLIARAFNAPVGSVLTDRMFMSNSDFRRSGLHADWLRPHHFDETLQVRLARNEQTMVG